MSDFICCDCEDECELEKESFHYSGTHCTNGNDGIHYTGFYISECCGADYKDKEQCSLCEDDSYLPTHNGSKMCESGSIASGGNKSHCTCSMCF